LGSVPVWWPRSCTRRAAEFGSGASKAKLALDDIVIHVYTGTP
jgi:hypothetical protein